ncbi:MULTISPECIES: cytochrome c551 [unclassified Bacillus (in: firmicutes)]|uniref:cytochrome c551 n=1 Tax=unclassified Bacillus (in: firmicutes) TaxID=185979 RepID=UPI0008F25746|nr:MULTISPECIES: cytochrome c [unclassified Bacillus (in: firmicutes)]SFB21678.1 cytochrome c551 [Bacillus sp. UNCCL13]SFQ91009.1 cytochrome c551 [Bacillus sp. cl95]
MKKKLIALLMGTSLVLAACGGGDNDSKSTDTAAGGDGQKLFEQKCSACHGVDLAGGVGPKLKGTSLSKEEIENIIHNGRGAMPKGLLEGEDASKVAEWVSNQ